MKPRFQAVINFIMQKTSFLLTIRSALGPSYDQHLHVSGISKQKIHTHLIISQQCIGEYYHALALA